MFRKYCLKNKFLYELDENEEKKDNYFKYNLKADKTYNLLLEEMNNNIHGNGEQPSSGGFLSLPFQARMPQSSTTARTA